MKMSVKIGNQSFTATLEDNAAVHELVKMMEGVPISINMDDYSGFEKVGSLWDFIIPFHRQRYQGGMNFFPYIQSFHDIAHSLAFIEHSDIIQIFF